MSDYSIKRIDQMEAVFGGGFVRARSELGVESFGMQVLRFPPNADQYPEHTHEHDSQEEVFAVMSGSGEIELDGDRHPLDTDTLVRVGPGVKRKLYSGPEGMRVLALGGVPGKAYEPPEVTEVGAPDPLAAS